MCSKFDVTCTHHIATYVASINCGGGNFDESSNFYIKKWHHYKNLELSMHRILIM